MYCTNFGKQVMTGIKRILVIEGMTIIKASI
mgnify:CR=1 FL=1|jgi:hypothetical protein